MLPSRDWRVFFVARVHAGWGEEKRLEGAVDENRMASQCSQLFSLVRSEHILRCSHLLLSVSCSVKFMITLHLLLITPVTDYTCSLLFNHPSGAFDEALSVVSGQGWARRENSFA